MATTLRRLARSARLDLLRRRVTRAYSMGRGERRLLADAIYEQRAETWRITLTEEAQAVGSSKTGQGPRQADERYLRRLSNADAASIVSTFNSELANEVERLISGDGEITRESVVRGLATWARRRQDYKTQQITNMNRNSARSYAQQRFNQENRIGDARFGFAGPPPREEICAGHFQAGSVDAEYVAQNPTPIHINCPHWWERQAGTPGVPIDELWVG